MKSIITKQIRHEILKIRTLFTEINKIKRPFHIFFKNFFNACLKCSLHCSFSAIIPSFWRWSNIEDIHIAKKNTGNTGNYTAYMASCVVPWRLQTYIFSTKKIWNKGKQVKEIVPFSAWLINKMVNHLWLQPDKTSVYAILSQKPVLYRHKYLPWKVNETSTNEDIPLA